MQVHQFDRAYEQPHPGNRQAGKDENLKVHLDNGRREALCTDRCGIFHDQENPAGKQPDDAEGEDAVEVSFCFGRQHCGGLFRPAWLQEHFSDQNNLPQVIIVQAR